MLFLQGFFMKGILHNLREKAFSLCRDDKDLRYVTDEGGSITYYPSKFSLFGYVVSESQKKKCSSMNYVYLSLLLLCS